MDEDQIEELRLQLEDERTTQVVVINHHDREVGVQDIHYDLTRNAVVIQLEAPI